MTATDRVLELEGVHNFRDYGGYAVAGGGRLKRGLLWRSGQHHGATDDDLAKIADLGLVTVFDLRGSVEREAHPCRRPEGFAAAVHIPQSGQEGPAKADAPHLAVAEKSRQHNAVGTREGMRANYGGIAFRPGLTAMIRQYLAALAEGRGPSLVNCMAGKDRTGIAVAILHLATGVHRDDAIADYLLTNTAGNVEARIAAGAAAIRALGGPVDDERIKVIMGVEAEYLENAFALMAERHGSIDAYLAEMVGADAALRARLREALVEG